MKQPPPPGARLGGYHHGDVVSEFTAHELTGRPDFPDDWLIVPSEDGQTLTLALGDTCTLEELTRAADRNTLHLALLRASDVPTGTA